MRSLRKLRHELVQDTRKLGDIVKYALHSPALLFIVKDLFTGQLASYRVACTSAADVQGALQHFLGIVRPNIIYSDNSDEIIRAVKDMGFGGRREFSQPAMSQTNGVAERAVQDVLDGARALMVHAVFLGMFGDMPLRAIAC